MLTAHQASVELITSLRAQVDSYRVHTNALKGELSAACRRQLTSMAASLDYQVSQYVTKSKINHVHAFIFQLCIPITHI